MACFKERRRKGTKWAGALEGLKVGRIINEPAAAAFVYGLDRLEAPVLRTAWWSADSCAAGAEISKMANFVTNFRYSTSRETLSCLPVAISKVCP
ncbi:hypothetical protein FJQ54_16080 [Sandaracinobacter neustonicus]|uniref:Uncharacterized protein n=1 Tax=Sandaracinobacter neustonicus TaxID=1715348 RepID=A0A501XDK7_9SPHN|nr:hypothetical protein FJQ54_16080 [Sandaracinobacter neustonicus]